MQEAPKVSLLIQLSLGIPNLWGLPQLMMEDVGGRPLLFHTLSSLVCSERLSDIWVLCSSDSCDDGIERLLNAFPKPSKIPVRCLRLPGDKDWSLTRNNIHRMARHPERLMPMLGAYSLGGFSFAEERIRFETAVLTWAEFIPFLSGTFLDAILTLYPPQELAFFPWRPRQTSVAIMPYREVLTQSEELRSEIAQNWDQKKSLIQEQARSHKLSKNDVKKKLDCFLHRHVLAWSILSLAPKMSSHAQALSKLFSEEPLSPTFPVCTREQLAEIHALWPSVERLRKHCQTADAIRSFLGSGEYENKLADFSFDAPKSKQGISAEHLMLDVESFTAETLASLLSQFHPSPFMVTLGCSRDPVPHPRLLSMIGLLRRMQIPYVQIKTPQIPGPAALKSWIETGLNGVLLDLDGIFKNSKASRLAIEALLQVKETFIQTQECQIYLQISFESEKVPFIQELHAYFEYRVDGIVVLPPKNNPPPVDLTISVASSSCLWSQNTLAVRSPDSLFLCEEWDQETWPLNEASFQEIKALQGRHPPCLSCKKRGRNNGFLPDSVSEPLSIMSGKESFASRFLKHQLCRLLLSSAERGETGDLKQLVAAIQSSKFRVSESILLRAANFLSAQKEPLLVLDLLEIIFQSNPAQKEAREALEGMASFFRDGSLGAG